MAANKDIEVWANEAKLLGLEGTAARDYILAERENKKLQVENDRKDRLAERDRQKEKEEAELKRQKRKRKLN